MKRIPLTFLAAFAFALTFASPAYADTPILPKPEIIINPSPPIALVTQMPVWLAVKEWDSFDTIDGPAVPVSVTYDMGNGNSVTCHDKGVVWNKSLGNNQSTNCFYVYPSSSAATPKGSFDIKGHLTYALGDQTVDGPVATLHVVVSEIQALNISPNQQNSRNVEWDQSKSPENHDNGGRSGLLGAIADFVGSALDAIGSALGMTASAIGSFIKGFAIGVVDLAKGLYQLAELSYRLGPTRMMIDPIGWAKDMDAFLQVAATIIGHPVDSLKAIGKDAIRWDTFADGKYAQGIGELLPNLLLIVASKGAGSLAKAGTVGRTAEELAAAARSAKYVEESLPAAAKIAGLTPAQLAEEAAKAAAVVESQIPKVAIDAAKEAEAAKRLAQAESDAGSLSHFFSRHGAQVTLEQLYIRIKTGVTPDGNIGTIYNATRFLSNDLQSQAYAKVIEEWKAGGALAQWTGSVNMETVVGDGFLKGSAQYATTQKVTAVIKDGKLITMYPDIKP